MSSANILICCKKSNGMDLSQWALIVLLVAVGVALAYILLQYTSATVRLARTLPGMDIYKGLLQVSPMACSATDSKTKVCDFYAAASSRSVFPADTLYDYVSADALTKVLATGARWLELDVFEEGGQPVVAYSKPGSGFRLTYNSVALADCLHAIAGGAWSTRVVPNASDPLFLSVNIHSDSATLINKVAAALKDVLRPWMLDLRYSHQSINIAQEPLCSLKGKLVVVSGGNHAGTDMDELVNLSWSGPYLRRLTFTQAEEVHDTRELIDFNRKNLTMVVPEVTGSLTNNPPGAVWALGCQAVLMSFGSPDKAMATYLEKFQTVSFVEKPEELRYVPPTYKSPTPQDARKSYRPLQLKTPFITATI